MDEGDIGSYRAGGLQRSEENSLVGILRQGWVIGRQWRDWQSVPAIAVQAGNHLQKFMYFFILFLY